ncbi:hypothetical protein [Pectobacterium parmentieri]|uniref:hypothetical protein n=1 Tax=Pectobacterium parmentieri TaxID=1905730 RepID=UPI0018DF7F1B|nr:hypothetical protein [Pectobacterium parmentieri]MBI0552798.1 hypothetical protein [Pectobacterium parmentieri]MBI0561820.1 hypothetical protein [Pectobacterium parmentieri]MBI0566096.1 hypothetical protein [Pectobacterium parmentieri]
MATFVSITRVNRRTINAITEQKETNASLLKADASFTEISEKVKISGGFSHATGKSQTGATIQVQIEPLSGDITHATFNMKNNLETKNNSTSLTKTLFKNDFFCMSVLKISQFTGAIGEEKIISPEGLQQITLWFGSQKTVNDAFGINIMTHSQVRNNGSIK